MRCYRANIGAVESNNFTYSECMFLALGIQHAIRMRRSVKFGMSSFTIFFHIVLLRARFSRKKIIERMMCVLIFSATFV